MARDGFAGACGGAFVWVLKGRVGGVQEKVALPAASVAVLLPLQTWIRTQCFAVGASTCLPVG